MGRGLFRTFKRIILNSDVNGAYNIIRKVFPDTFNKFIRNGELMIVNVKKAIGIEGIVLHPLRLSVSDLFRGRIHDRVCQTISRTVAIGNDITFVNKC